MQLKKMNWDDLIKLYLIKVDSITHKKWFDTEDRVFYYMPVAIFDDQVIYEVGSYVRDIGWNEGKLTGDTIFEETTDEATAQIKLIEIWNNEMKKIKK